MMIDILGLLATILVYRITGNVLLSAGVFAIYGFITRLISTNDVIISFMVCITTFGVTVVAILLLRALRNIFR